ncbi:MAG TPA: sugar transferase [Micromonospora sp.]|nr:sugar transferase [Micromonospora sp.]
MGGWLFMASLLLTMAAATGTKRIIRRPATSRMYRGCVLASLALTMPVWCWSYLSHGLSPLTSLLPAAGAVIGGMVATAAGTGFVEDNAPPSVGVREKLLAYHASRALAYPPEPRLKRAFDVTLAAAGLAVTFPLWVVISGLIWWEEPGPILFTKNSVGKGGVTFRQFKFRSMKYGAERSTGPVASPASDPRTLRCGRWIRRWHIDELPELLNVLAGTMSLVGPRPLRAVLVQRYLEELPEFAERHTVKPGIACIAQIQKYHIAPAERLRKDRAYIRRMSVPFDLSLLWHAVTSTLRGPRNET